MANWGRALGDAGNMLGYMKQLELQDKKQKQADEGRARAVLMQARQDAEYNRQQAELPQMNELRNLQRDVMKTRLEGQKADLQPVPQPSILSGLTQAISGQIPDFLTHDPSMTVGDKKAQDRAKKIEMARVKFALDKAENDRRESDRIAARNFDYSKQLRGLPTYRQSHGSSGGSGNSGGERGRQTGPMSTTELSQTVPSGSMLTLPGGIDLQSPFSHQKQVLKIHDNGKANGKYFETPSGDKFTEREIEQMPPMAIQDLGLAPLLARSPKLAYKNKQYHADKAAKPKKEGKPSKYAKPFKDLSYDEKQDIQDRFDKMTVLPPGMTIEEYYAAMQALENEGGDTDSGDALENEKLKLYGR